MTVNAFAKDKLGKSPNLNCFTSYLFHGRRRRRLFPFQLFVLVIQLSLSVKGRVLQTKWGWSWAAGSELLAPSAQEQEPVLGWAELEPFAPSHLGSAASVSSLLPFQGFWSFSISFCCISFTCTVLQALFWGVCIFVNPFQSWSVKLENGRRDS